MGVGAILGWRFLYHFPVDDLYGLLHERMGRSSKDLLVFIRVLLPQHLHDLNAAISHAFADMLGFFVETISNFAREFKRHHADLYSQMDNEVIRRVADREGGGCFTDSASSVSRPHPGPVGHCLLAPAIWYRDRRQQNFSALRFWSRF
jgi:hypothetical protein